MENLDSEKKTDPINLKNLNEALSKAQGAIEAALKTAENPAFKKDGKASKYADIFEVIEVIKVPAKENGLSVNFNFKSTLDSKEDVLDWIQYIIRHSSGELFVSDWLYMRSRGATQHDFGASNTYYRRQLLKSIYQIPEDDDDGNSQSLSDQGKKSNAQGSQNSSKPNQAAASKPAIKNHAPGAQNQADPADYVIPLGTATKGKKVREVPEQTLIKAYEWANDQFRAGQESKEITEMINNIGAFLASVGVKHGT